MTGLGRIDTRSPVVPEDVLRNPARWVEVTKTEAVRIWRRAPVVIVASADGRRTAEWYKGISRIGNRGNGADPEIRYFRYSGPLPVLPEARRWGSVPFQDLDKEEEPQEESDGAGHSFGPADDEADQKTSWVKFKVVDDATGKPIQGIELEIDLPGGEGADHPTDNGGMVAIDGIAKGRCTVRCSLEGARLTDTLAFVGMGETPINQSENDDSEAEDKHDDASDAQGTARSDPNGSDTAALPAAGNPEASTEDEEESDESSGGTWRRIAVIEEYKVKTGDTLKSLAKSCGMTWQELAEFNWGTSDPGGINEHLRDDVGCRKKTADGDNYVFDDSDDPGIVYLPVPLKKDGLATEQTHTIRAKAPADEFYVLAVEVRSIGGTPIMNHAVRIRDPDTGEQIGGDLMTDDDGVVRALVPENKLYRIEILDEEHDFVDSPLDDEGERAMLLCHFLDEWGEPIAHTDVHARSGDDEFELVTDENGKIEAPADLGHYELTIEDQVFHAHALLEDDRDAEEHLYRFVVTGRTAQPDDGEDDRSAAELRTFADEEEESGASEQAANDAAGAQFAGENAPGRFTDKAVLRIRLPIDPAAREAADDTFTLYSTDGSYRRTLTVKDDSEPGDNCLDLAYEDLDRALTYTLEIHQGANAQSYMIFEATPFGEIAQLTGDTDE
jgi:hypothetical protein